MEEKKRNNGGERNELGGSKGGIEMKQGTS